MSKNKTLFHLSHKDNFISILNEGILSKNELHRKKINYHDISFSSVQRRRNIIITIKKNEEYDLHGFVPFFYRPKTPMLYSKQAELPNLFLAELCLEKVLASKDILYLFTDGNAAVRSTNFYHDWEKDSHKIVWSSIKDKYWGDSGKSAASSEFLVFTRVDISLIERIIVMIPSEVFFYKQKLKEFGIKKPIDVVVSRKCFP